jgi:hypothetical protein
MADVDAYTTGDIADLSSNFSIRGPVGEHDAYLTSNNFNFSSLFWTGNIPVVDLKLLFIVQNGIECLRLTFNAPPIQLDVTGINDALNPSNYTIDGPYANLVSSVVSVKGDPTSVDVYITKQLINGTWTLKVSNVLAA